MRRFFSVTIPLAILVPLINPAHSLAQDRSRELQRFDRFIGGWADSIGGDAEQVCSWVGESFVQCPAIGTDPAGPPVTTMFLMGFDADAEAYTAFRFYSSGFHDTGEGWVDGDTWTFIYGDDPGRIIRFTGIWESDDVWAYRWERSVEGGEWVETSAGKAFRVK